MISDRLTDIKVDTGLVYEVKVQPNPKQHKSTHSKNCFTFFVADSSDLFISLCRKYDKLFWQVGKLFWQVGKLFWQMGKLFWKVGKLFWQGSWENYFSRWENKNPHSIGAPHRAHGRDRHPPRT